ncbi:hypothetical protein LEMLEM_LOCUS8876 [Lemmus lemmus]
MTESSHSQEELGTVKGSPCCSGARSADQPGFEFRDLPASASAVLGSKVGHP